MDDGHRTVEFGFFPVPAAADRDALLRQVRLAEELGLDLVGIQDHPYQRRYLDTFALVAWVLALTERVRVFPDVAHLPLRPPAMLAKTAASLDVLSGGRFELGLGAGGFTEASRAMGAPHRDGPELVAALEEGIGILRRFWSTPERGIAHEGDHYRLEGVKAGPEPAHDIGIWVGASGPAMLRLVGRLADGWVPSSGWAPPDVLAEKGRAIDRAAEDAGRDPRSIRRIYNVSGLITDGPTESYLHGPADHWVDELTRLATDLHVDAFVLWPDQDPEAQLHAFAEVAAAVRAS